MTVLAGAGPIVSAGTGERPKVSWGTVLPLAVVAAFGSEFWLVAVRGAVGAIERTQDPFMAWLEESTLLLPVYVFAVLAALTLALRWFGPGRQRLRASATTLLLVVVAATLAALAVQTANAVYDYQLQAGHLATVATHGTCDAGCLADRQHSALLLQVRAIGLNGVVMVVSNLVLLSLVVAFRGGRLDTAARRRIEVGTRQARARGRFGDARAFLAVCLLGTATIHAAVVPAQLAEWPAAGVFFVVLCVVEITLAVLVLARSRPAVLRAVAVLSAGTVMLWVDSRSDGLSFGPGAGVAEPVGVADGAATLLGVATLVGALAVLKRRGWLLRPSVPQHRVGLALVSAVAVAFIGLGGGLGVFGGDGHPVRPGETGVTTDTSHHAAQRPPEGQRP